MGETGKGRAIFLREPLAILTPDGIDARGGLLVRDGVIEQVFAPGAAPVGDVETVDVSRHVVLPGLINTHHHFYQTLTRAHPAAINRELFDWLTALYPLWARLTPDHLRIATRLALTELMLSGVTCASDHHYVFPQGLDAAMDIQAEEAAALGIRIVLNRGSMNLSVRDGGLPPDSVVQDADTILADCERVIARHHDARPGAMTQVALAPCSPFSVTRELMVGTAELAARCGCALHTHLAETFDENAFCEARYGCRPLDYLEQTGWLTDRTWLAHGVHFDDDELVRLGVAGVGVCHCPTSNMVLASGQCRTRELEAAGAPVGLGVDGSASNDSSNLMEGVRHALMIGRLTYDASLTHLDALRWATEGSARCLGRGDIGAIAEGRQADLALFTLDELRFSGAHDPLAALVLCGAHRADRVMIAGRWTVVDGQPVGVDMQALRAAHGRAALDFASR
ncbi:8-oxoguanine deaminase [Roseitalea porphyridii]|uniref:8-oxoguanine deaminase n=1 Tax=Roseitalea porphyridii TaxID=1852022 RepID=A0A4P6V3J5_9HYPH|nr:8-oxoguanine deaminase [Roseitalea porphyridii]QBK31795.1 8-oxoguanine deaminase [Roseitalea porphyridii]